MRARPVVGAAALTAAVFAVGSWSAVRNSPDARAAPATPPASTPIPGPAEEILARPDGSISLSLERALGRVDPAGTVLAPTGLATPPPATSPNSADNSFSLQTLTADGGLAALDWVQPGPVGHAVFSQLGPDGAVVGPPAEVPSWGGGGIPDRLVAGPTGAIAVIGPSAQTSGTNPRVVFRPAGATSFGTALKIDPSLGARYRADPYLNQTRGYLLALGPDGGGAVFVSPGGVPAKRPYVRRISTAGQLGRPIPVALPDHDATDLNTRIAFGPGGALVVAMATTDADSTGESDNAVWLTSLAPGASRTTRVRRLAHDHDDGSDLGTDDAPSVADIDLAVGANDRVLLTVEREHGGPAVYEGSPTSAKRTATLSKLMDERYFGVVAPDGSATVVALGETAGKGDARILLAAHHAPGQPFRPARAITPPADFYIPSRPVVLPDGELALSVLHFDSEQHTTSWLQRLRF